MNSMRGLCLKITILVMSFLGLLSIAPVMTYAALDCTNPATTADAIQCGTCNSAGAAAATCDADPGTTLNSTTKNIINLLSLVAGAAAVIMLIIGGFRYTTSAGNPESAKAARNTILYGVIGLVVVAVAQVVVHFVLSNTTSAVTGS